MALNVDKWNTRILEDYRHIQSKYHRIWRNNRDVMNNEGEGSRFGNLTKEFAGAVRARLIHKNFFVRVDADDPDFAGKARELTIMSNSLSRSVELKETLDDATEDSLWAGTGWLEVGHTLDLHSFDIMRSILHNGPNSFNPEDYVDEYVEVPEDEVRAELGNEADNITPFDATLEPNITSTPEPVVTFDPEAGAPWITNVSPFFIVLPRETKDFRDADYVTKLVLISLEELKLVTDMTLPDNIVASQSEFEILIDETPGGTYIDKPVVVAITFIRRDRNDPRYSGWYLAHVLSHPSIVLKNAPNPYGGMIPIIPAKSRSSMRIIAKSWIEDLRPYTDNYAKILEGLFKRMRAGLAIKWTIGSGASITKVQEINVNNVNYNGRINLEAGQAEDLKYIEGPGLTYDHIQSLNLVSKLAQGEAGQTDIDRGTPVKKITARQTEALLQTSALMMEAIRGPVVKAGNEAVIKLVHLLNLFSTQRAHVYSFGGDLVELEPGGNDYTTSYRYKISVRDLEGPANAESQLLFVQFVKNVAALPQFANEYNWRELADEGRRFFGMGPEVMARLQAPGMIDERSQAGMPGQGVVSSGRPLASQGNPDGGSIDNALSALNRL